MDRIRFWFLAALSAIPLQSLAYSSAKYYHPNYKMEKVAVCPNNVCRPYRLIGTLTGGAGFIPLGQTENFTTAGTTYTYDPNSGTQTRWAWGAAAGQEFRFYPDWAVDITIGYYQIATTDATGTATQASTSYTYQYSVNSKQYLLEAKFISDMSFGFHVYGFLGVGSAFNQQGSFTITSGNPTDPPLYSSNTNYNFAYSAGVGFDFDVTQFARIGLGYRFIGTGPADLGDGTIAGIEINNNIGQSNLNVQQAYAQLTLLI